VLTFFLLLHGIPSPLLVWSAPINRNHAPGAHLGRLMLLC
jgi:hypothetical protein